MSKHCTYNSNDTLNYVFIFQVYGNSPLPIVEADPPTISVLSVEPPHPILSHSASNSTGLSSTHTENGSQVEDVSPNPSQENSQSNNVSIFNNRYAITC